MLPDSHVDAEIHNLHRSETVERMRNEVQNPNALALLTKDDGKTIGVALGNLREDGGVAHLGFLGVISSDGRRGFGSSVLHRGSGEEGSP